MTNNSGPTARDWLARLHQPDARTLHALQATYGDAPSIVKERCALLERVLRRYVDAYGDEPVRVFRSPGRINLRGMHVDTHGGYLNLTTHQREVVLVVAESVDDRCEFVNIDPQFKPFTFSIQENTAHSAFSKDWLAYITHPDVQGEVQARRGDWSNYLRGAMLRVQHRFPDTPMRGLRGAVGSDLPFGAALSSSTALTTATVIAALTTNEFSMDADELILAVMDSEWYTGSRGGTSDQSAMILGGLNEIVNVAMAPSDPDAARARRVSLPEDYCVLVINSFTRRSISGAQMIDYARNRFAYSLAFEIVRQALRELNVEDAVVARIDRLPRLSSAALQEVGGTELLWRIVRAVPETLTLDELRTRYDLPNLESTYTQYFGMADDAMKPATFAMRGPLLFGIAESERARQFGDALVTGDIARAARLMSIGHDGDRVMTAAGKPYTYDVSDSALDALAHSGDSEESCPGVYGASTPALDTLVDTALSAGALGASLTGAGLAGNVLALCKDEDTPKIRSAIVARMQAEDYPSIAKREDALSTKELDEAVLINHATASVGELLL
jgi:galactokinase